MANNSNLSKKALSIIPYFRRQFAAKNRLDKFLSVYDYFYENRREIWQKIQKIQDPSLPMCGLTDENEVYFILKSFKVIEFTAFGSSSFQVYKRFEDEHGYLFSIGSNKNFGTLSIGLSPLSVMTMDYPKEEGINFLINNSHLVDHIEEFINILLDFKFPQWYEYKKLGIIDV
jgi:hypothetical protein